MIFAVKVFFLLFFPQICCTLKSILTFSKYEIELLPRKKSIYFLMIEVIRKFRCYFSIHNQEIGIDIELYFFEKTLIWFEILQSSAWCNTYWNYNRILFSCIFSGAIFGSHALYMIMYVHYVRTIHG